MWQNAVWILPRPPETTNPRGFMMRTYFNPCWTLMVSAAFIGCAKSPSKEASNSATINSEKSTKNVQEAGVSPAQRRTTQLDLSEFGMPVTLNAPVGSTARQANGADDTVIDRADRFAIEIQRDGKPQDDEKPPSENIVREEDGTVVFKTNDLGVRFAANISAGSHDYLCSSHGVLIEAGIEEPFTLEEVEFMLKCAKSLSIKLVDGKPFEELADQPIPEGYPPDDPSKMEIAIDGEGIKIGGYLVRQR